MFRQLLPTAAEAAELKSLVAQMEAANARIDASLAEWKAMNARDRAFDEAAYKERVPAELEARTDIDWGLVAERPGLA